MRDIVCEPKEQIESTESSTSNSLVIWMDEKEPNSVIKVSLPLTLQESNSYG